MAKINEEVFEQVSNEADLQTNRKKTKSAKTCNVLVYDVPEAWKDAIRDNSMTISSFFKAAVKEKLIKDKLLSKNSI